MPEAEQSQAPAPKRHMKYGNTRQLYKEAREYYHKDTWTIHFLMRRRLRMVIRLVALEERCIELDIGALPPKIMTTLRLMSDFKEAHRPMGRPISLLRKNTQAGKRNHRPGYGQGSEGRMANWPSREDLRGLSNG